MLDIKKIYRIVILLGILMGSIWNISYGQSKKGFNHSKKPNIIIILADDMGWGLVQAYNHTSVIPTPNINSLAEEGMLFTNAHTASAVCTPTRYGLMTGRYPWRTRLKQGVLFPPAKPLISEDRLTLGSLLKKQGYYTAVVGKWHLGLGWAMKDSTHINFNRPVTHSPNSFGFDYSFIIPASLDMPPYCYIKNGHVVEKPTVHVPKSKFGRAGLAVPGLEPEDVLPRLTKEVVKVVNEHANQKGDKAPPLFLYYALTAPHTPIAPSKRFRGKTQMGRFGDFVYEVDWVVGKIMKALRDKHMVKNTLLIFTADNGTSPAGAREAMKNGQDVNGPWRGYKTDIWEGGSRVPFIARWPGHVPAGTTQDALISLNDMLATFAVITGANLPPSAGVDSYNILSVMLHKKVKIPPRTSTIIQSSSGYFGILHPPWKAAFVAGSGGWGSSPHTKGALKRGLPRVQLYNLSVDKGETNNLQAGYPNIVWMLRHLLLHYIDRGRSTPGPMEQNWKGKTRWEQVSRWVVK